MRVTPVPGCRGCWGTGIVTDTVPWGSTAASLESYCDCVTDQVEDENEEIEIVPVEALADPFDYEQEYEFLEMMSEQARLSSLC